MMFKCNECGFEFDEPTKWITESGIEHGCPNCGASDMEDLVKCELCGSFHVEDEMIGNVCENCIDEDLKPMRMVTIGNHHRVDVSLNGFLTYVFSEGEINQILLQEYQKLDLSEQQSIVNRCIHDYPNEVSEAYIETVEGGEL